MTIIVIFPDDLNLRYLRVLRSIGIYFNRLLNEKLHSRMLPKLHITNFSDYRRKCTF